jgi:gluconate 5-dehydrogenase
MYSEKLELKDRVAIVTGAGRGLGRQMALALAMAGADIVAAALRRGGPASGGAAGRLAAPGRIWLSLHCSIRFKSSGSEHT